MKFIVRPGKTAGEIRAPASKSHTIRALALASLAHGVSTIRNPLDSLDSAAAAAAFRAFGARIDTAGAVWTVEGVGGEPKRPDAPVDTLNSGTTLYVAMSTAALIPAETTLTGDEQIQRRPAGPLLAALRDLGCDARSTKGDDTPPVVIRGRMKGGRARLRAVTSQYLTSLLIHCPLADAESEISVTELNEKPYVEMTLDWLRRRGIRLEHNDALTEFRIPGGQEYTAFDAEIPGDFSSAAFFLVAAAITGGPITFLGLDMNDTQGDKAVADMLRAMGAEVTSAGGSLTLTGRPLHGLEIDLNATPDAIPAMAAAACAAEGETRLVNVQQARVKETDRLAVMREELEKMGADVTELPDGLVIRGGRQLKGAALRGHGDHRVVMALAVAALTAAGPSTIDTAESVAVTFPAFVDYMRALGADIECVE